MDELDSGTATEAAPQGLDTPEPTGEATASATPAVGTPAAPQEESFLDATPARKAEIMDAIRADPRLAAVHGWMQAAHTKKSEQTKRWQASHNEVERFYNDLAYQEQILQRVATQRGYQLVRPGQQSSAGQPLSTGQSAGQAPPQDFVARIEAELAPELKWMAPSLAKTQWAAIQPIIQQRQQEVDSRNMQDIEAAEVELAGKFPGWEVEKENMNELLAFLQSGPIRHPKFGNRLEVLYKASQLLAGHQGHVVQDYAKRTAEAARSRTVSSNAARPSLENYSEQIRKAPKSSDAFAIATKVAEDELRRAGVTI